MIASTVPISCARALPAANASLSAWLLSTPLVGALLVPASARISDALPRTIVGATSAISS